MTVFWRLVEVGRALTAVGRDLLVAMMALTREIKGLREDLAVPVPTRAAFTVGQPIEE